MWDEQGLARFTTAALVLQGALLGLLTLGVPIGVCLCLAGIARTENQADALTTIVALGLAVLGGSFFFGSGGVVSTLKLFTITREKDGSFVVAAPAMKEEAPKK